MAQKNIATVDEYIAGFGEPTRSRLEEIRTVIQKAAPEAKEKISYQMPTYDLNGNLVHFAGYAKHIGFYPTPSGITAFESEIAKYTYAKGSVQFPLDQPLPVSLISRIVKFRVKENQQKSAKRKSKP